MKYTTEQIESIEARIRKKPHACKDIQQHSKQQAIKMLSKAISYLRKNGYTFEQVAKVLTEEGVEISVQTLKNYIKRARSGEKTSSIHSEISTKSVLSENKQAGTKKSTILPKEDSDNI